MPCLWDRSRVSNEVVKVPDLGYENITALFLTFPHEADFTWNVFYIKRTEVSKWQVWWGGPVLLCPHSSSGQSTGSCFLGYPPQPDAVSEAAVVLQAVVPSENFTFIKITVKLLCISVKHGVSAGLCKPHYVVLDPFISCWGKGWVPVSDLRWTNTGKRQFWNNLGSSQPNFFCLPIVKLEGGVGWNWDLWFETV